MTAAGNVRFRYSSSVTTCTAKNAHNYCWFVEFHSQSLVYDKLAERHRA